MDIEDMKMPEGTENQSAPAKENAIIDAVLTPEKPKNPFVPDMSDFVFGLAAFVLGYLFARWAFFTWRGWGVAVFTTVYLLSAAAYLIKKGFSIKNPPALFWLGITWLTGLSYALWDGRGLEPVRTLFMFCAAVYFVIIASGCAIMGGTGNYLLIDGVNAVVLVPFRNIINQYVSFTALRRKKRGNTGAKKRLPVILGILLALLIVVWLIPLLERADSGGFSQVLSLFTQIFSLRSEKIVEFFVYCFFAIPVAAYLYGLVSGAAHRRGTETITPENAKKAVNTLRFLQPATVYIALGAVCALYLIFIVCQIPYFFSAFAGNRPEGWLVYSEFARKGFFELCQIAAINLVVITAGNVTCAKKRGESRILMAFNIALALITLLLIATAFSKMAMYIGVYGLSMLRLLPCVFMVFLAAVFIALIMLQKRDFSIVRFALVTGSIIVCALCLANPDAIVVRYNTGRYLAGTLSDYDTDILYRAGAAGVLPALEVYEQTENGRLKSELAGYLESQGAYMDYDDGGHILSYELYTARERLRETGAFNGDEGLNSP